MHSSADYQPPASPRKVLSIDSGVCPNPLRNCLDGFFLRADLIAVNHHVVVADAIDVVSNQRKRCRSA